MKITDEMIEKAAQELYYCWNSEPGVKLWLLLTSLRTKPYRVAAECMLSAVAPLIRSAALEEAARVADEKEDGLVGEAERFKGHVEIAHGYMMRATVASDVAAAIRALKDKSHE